MNKKYIVTLTETERAELKGLIQKGQTQGYRIKHAQILLRLDEIPSNAGWSQHRVAEACMCSRSMVQNVAQRFVEQGLEAALGRKEQKNRRRKIDGEVEARMVAIACSKAPDGRSDWTLQLIADELVLLEVVDSISATAVGTTLKKTNLSLGGKKSGVSRKRGRSL